MPDPGIEAYLTARREFGARAHDPWWYGDSARRREMNDYEDQMFTALHVLLSPQDQATVKPWAVPQDLEDAVVWKPLLIEEHQGDIAAAEAAWGRGERPAQYLLPPDTVTLPSEHLYSLSEAAAEWEVTLEDAGAALADGRVRGIHGRAGNWLIPIGEVARWQGVLGQNRAPDASDAGR